MIILFVIIELFHKKINNPHLWIAQKLMIIYASIKNHNYTNLLKLDHKSKSKSNNIFFLIYLTEYKQNIF